MSDTTKTDDVVWLAAGGRPVIDANIARMMERELTEVGMKSRHYEEVAQLMTNNVRDLEKQLTAAKARADEWKRLALLSDDERLAAANTRIAALEKLLEAMEQTLHEANARELALREANMHVNRCVGFFKSVIQCGETWSSTCQKLYDELDDPPSEPAAPVVPKSVADGLRALLRETCWTSGGRKEFDRQGFSLFVREETAIRDVNYRAAPLHETADLAIDAALADCREVAKP